MALNEYTLSLLSQIEFTSVLSFGYPDIVVSRETLVEITGIEVEKVSGHGSGWHGVKFPLPDTLEFFQKKGAHLTCVDYKQLRGYEIVADLNYPHDFGEFDVVIDPGTIEHCFNVSQAAFTAANSVKEGGYILHVNPVSMVNHGFYNLSPTWYFDFYESNGFDVLRCFVVGKNFENDLPHKDRVIIPPEVSAYTLARRRVKTSLKPPIQAKYKKFLDQPEHFPK